MLIAPFSPSAAARPRNAIRPASPARSDLAPPGALIAWLVLGIGAVLCIPIARGDRMLGATLPFWFVVAPLINLAWISRRRIARRVSGWLSAQARSRPGTRNVRAQRAPRVACNAARS